MGLSVHLLVIVEAMIGLGLVALLISFLPTMYGHFSKREVLVTQIHNWSVDDGAGITGHHVDPHPSASTGSIGCTTHGSDWEMWFVELEETHTSFPALAFFRSPTPDRSWVTMSGIVLDGAALFLSCVNTTDGPTGRHHDSRRVSVAAAHRGVLLDPARPVTVA